MQEQLMCVLFHVSSAWKVEKSVDNKPILQQLWRGNKKTGLDVDREERNPTISVERR